MTMIELPVWIEWCIAFMLIIGATFALIGSVGLARFPDFLTRLHAPTKSTTMGVGSVLISSIIYFSVVDTFSFHELLITIFLFLTAPISAHLLAKAALHLDLKRVEQTQDLRAQSAADPDKPK